MALFFCFGFLFGKMQNDFQSWTNPIPVMIEVPETNRPVIHAERGTYPIKIAFRAGNGVVIVPSRSRPVVRQRVTNRAWGHSAGKQFQREQIRHSARLFYRLAALAPMATTAVRTQHVIRNIQPDRHGVAIPCAWRQRVPRNLFQPFHDLWMISDPNGNWPTPEVFSAGFKCPVMSR